jgi:hypothetical protein
MTGKDPVKGFLGDVSGTPVAVLVYKQGKLQGQMATAYKASPNQLELWGVDDK